jgi:hypothetical protein
MTRGTRTVRALENVLTPAKAQVLHDDAAVRGKWLTWALTDTDVEHRGKHVACAHEADRQGGTLRPGALAANTLNDLRAMLPTQLTRRDRTGVLPCRGTCDSTTPSGPANGFGSPTNDRLGMTETLRNTDLCTQYADPVGRLLTIGETGSYDPAKWPDYVVNFGLAREHVAALACMVCDAALNRANTDSSEVWAPMHAWRALGQLGVQEAIAPLLGFLRTSENDDAVSEELPIVFGMIGPAAVPHIAAFLSDRSNPTSPVATAMAGLREIVARHPECRNDCVGILARVLEPHAASDPVVNGFAAWILIDLAAVEAIDVMRDAFRRRAVDLSLVGDEEDVEIALGLRKRRTTPAPSYHIGPPGWLDQPHAGGIQPGTRVLPQGGKVGRNDPCPCGSGRKYKKCCLQ